jgi:hypothetical protein
MRSVGCSEDEIETVKVKRLYARQDDLAAESLRPPPLAENSTTVVVQTVVSAVAAAAALAVAPQAGVDQVVDHPAAPEQAAPPADMLSVDTDDRAATDATGCCEVPRKLTTTATRNRLRTLIEEAAQQPENHHWIKQDFQKAGRDAGLCFTPNMFDDAWRDAKNLEEFRKPGRRPPTKPRT